MAETAPCIRRMLNASTGNLPEDMFGTFTEHPWVVANRTEHGVLMWVPNDPADSSRVCDPPVPAEVLAVQEHARGLGCDYVLFDADADPVPGLPFWEW